MEAGLPPVSLLVGPESVGKKTLVREVLGFHKVAPVDVWWQGTVTAESVRDVKGFVGTGPMSGPVKVAVLGVDGGSSGALNGLLKVLEEPPETARFVLVGTKMPLATIVSRAFVFRCGLLSRDEVRDVLVGLGMGESEARDAAVYGRGQVRPALEVGEIETAKVTVLGAVKAIAEGDVGLFDEVGKKWSKFADGGWTMETTRLLEQWCVEAMTGQWGVFSPQMGFGLVGTQYPGRILVALSAVEARPELAMRVGLRPLVVRRSKEVGRR